MAKRLIQPNTTFYPAEPPRLSISIRPARYSHDLIRRTGEFVLNLPRPDQALLADYVGVVSGREEDKFAVSGLRLALASRLKTPLLADCPVNIECALEQELNLDSHTRFIGRVLAVHAEESVLDANGDVDLSLAGGIAYGCGTVCERPTYNFQVETLRSQVHSARARDQGRRLTERTPS